MADITMCLGEGCSVKEKCYRHTANASKFQSYFSKPPITETGCSQFWPNKTKSK